MSSRAAVFFLAACWAVAILFFPASAWAHRLRPAIVNLAFAADGTYVARISLNVEVILAGIGPQHQDTSDSPNAQTYDALRLLPPEAQKVRIEEVRTTYLERIDLRFDGERAQLELAGAEVPEVGDIAVERLTTLIVRGKVPSGAREFTWSYAAAFGNNVLRVSYAGDETIRSAWLTEGAVSEPFRLGGKLVEKSTGQVAIAYLVLGFTHILPKGLDHVLFVLGIFLLSLRWGPLLGQVTAFTIAHSITLGLSLYGFISLSPRIVEPLIALSIVYVAVENILTRDLKPWRIVVVFCFGLLHGMGFAGVLLKLGLPREEFLTALITFNLGVEGGQLAVIALAFLAVGVWFKNRSWYRYAIVIPASAVISIIAAFWTVERILA